VAIPKNVTRIEDVHTVRKFPTILRVVDDSTSPIQLGFVPPHTDHQVVGKKVQCPKTFIMQWENKPVFDDKIRQGIADMNEGLDLPEERKMVTLFLNGLWDLARQLLQTDFPDADSEPHVVLTYPGFWSEAERATLTDAVEHSNIPGQACQACPIEYEKEQVAATYSVLAYHKNELRELKKVSLHHTPLPLSSRGSALWSEIPGDICAATNVVIGRRCFHGGRLRWDDGRKCKEAMQEASCTCSHVSSLY
jgi:hypothetical protein